MPEEKLEHQSIREITDALKQALDTALPELAPAGRLTLSLSLQAVADIFCELATRLVAAELEIAHLRKLTQCPQGVSEQQLADAGVIQYLGR